MNPVLSSDPAHSQLRRTAAWIAVVVAALLLPLLAGESIYLHTAVTIAITAIATIGMMIIYKVGQLSMVHAAFVGVGAYTSAVLSMRLGVPFLVGLAVSVAGVALAAALLGWLILRIRGVYFVLITFAVGQMIGLLFLDLESITGGAVGLPNVPPASLFGMKAQTPIAYYYLALAFCALTALLGTRLLASDTGRAWSSISSNLRLAESSGIPTMRYQILAFSIGSALAALAGALSAHYTRFVSPASYDMTLIVSLVVMLVLGGRNSVVGALTGTVFVVPLAEVLRDARDMQNIIYGLVVLLALWLFPEGLIGIPARIARLLSFRKAAPAKPLPAAVTPERQA